MAVFQNPTYRPPKKAIILAGGKGTRLKPYTTVFPKALVPLGDIPVLELVILQLKHHGFFDITFAVGHLASLIEAYFSDGSRWGVNISYTIEKKPLGTAGPIKTLFDLPENFLVMNADIVTDLNYSDFFETHLENVKDNKTLATIATYLRTSKIDFGIIETNPKTQQMEAFIEKPKVENDVSMGIYAFNYKILDFIPENTFFGFDMLMKTLINANQVVKIRSFGGYWLDIGRVDDYETAVNDFVALRDILLPSSCPDNLESALPEEAIQDPAMDLAVSR
ncbi:MAG: nucleotidyltransferase family protein [Cyanobacteria bacterium P01_H01_bin.74]